MTPTGMIEGPAFRPSEQSSCNLSEIIHKTLASSRLAASLLAPHGRPRSCQGILADRQGVVNLGNTKELKLPFLTPPLNHCFGETTTFRRELKRSTSGA